MVNYYQSASKSPIFNITDRLTMQDTEMYKKQKVMKPEVGKVQVGPKK